MPEIKIPDDLSPDCDNCQGLCCMSMSHRAKDGFPVDTDKPPNTPCVNLNSDPSRPDTLHQCSIYPDLLAKGWKECKSFSCHGAGQTASMYFKELGIDWALPSSDIDPAQRAILLRNLNDTFYVLYAVMGHLDFVKYNFPYANKERFDAANAAVKKVAIEFSEFIKTNEKIDIYYWRDEKFMTAINSAIEQAMRNYVKNKVQVVVTRVLSIFRRTSLPSNSNNG